MDHPETEEQDSGRGTGRGLRSGLLAAGAALGMTLAGLGIAAAQVGDSTTPPSTTEPGHPAPGTAAPAAPAPGAPAEEGPHEGCPHGHHKRARLAAAAAAIGIPEPELLGALRSGQSIAQVAESKNVQVQKVIDALVAEAKAHLADRVESGAITQAQADERAAGLTARITEMVNRTGFQGHRHHGAHRMPPAEAPVVEGSSTS